MLTRRSLLAQAATATLLAGDKRSRPNILWISCEDTGPQLGCYGDSYAVTPNLDKLATQGVRYTHAYTVAGVCAPSRSGIITGMYPSTLGSHYMRCNAPLPDFVKCFPEYLRNAGYYCTNNVKTDYNFPVPPNAWDEVSSKAHWRNRSKDQPFFAVFNNITTHESQVRKRGAEYEKMIPRVTAAQRRDPAAAKMPPYYPDTFEARRDWANYYELITEVDGWAGDHLKALEDAGLLENTIVFFWGDHGVGLPRAKRWLYESGIHVPLIISIPPRLRTGGQGKPGSVDDQLISFMDLAPTVLNLAGVRIPQHMQGRAFLGSGLSKQRKYVFAARDRMDERYDCIRTVRDKQFRYLRNYEPHKPYAQHLNYAEVGGLLKDLRAAHAAGKTPEGARLFMSDRKPVEELYDVRADPHEVHNLANSPEHQKTLSRMRAVHRKWIIDTRDLALIPEPIVEDRGRELGNRYAILRQAGSQQYLQKLLDFVDLVNRGGTTTEIGAGLRHSDAAFRYWAVVGTDAKDEIMAATKDESAVVRVAAASIAASRFGSREPVQTLIREMSNQNSFVRLHAVLALDELGSAAAPARDALVAAAANAKDEYVHRVAQHALRQ